MGPMHGGAGEQFCFPALCSRAMKFAAMYPESFARESGCLACFSDCQYKLYCLTISLAVKTDGITLTGSIE